MSFFNKLELGKKPLVLYPFLMAVFPIIFLYAYNISQADFSQALLPIAVALTGTFVTWLVLLLVLRNKFKAGLATIIFLGIFFLYGRVYEFLESMNMPVPGHAYVLPAVLLAWGYCVYFIGRAKNDFRGATNALNVIAAVLIIINLANITVYQATKKELVSGTPGKAAVASDNISESAPPLPDIYYLVFDEYASIDTIKDVYGYDNSNFIKSMEARGFFAVSHSKTRTPDSPQSIAQTLNMKYLTGGYAVQAGNKGGPVNYIEINPDAPECPCDLPWSTATFQKYACSEVARSLKSRGYTYIYFGYWGDKGRWDKYIKSCADRYYNYYEESGTPWTSEFQDILWNSTAVRPFYQRVTGNQYEGYYRGGVLNTLAHISRLPQEKSPKFVFAHIMCPHRPYVFGANGQFAEPLNYNNEKDLQYYRDQYIFTSSQIEILADSLQSKSEIQPVIIIQSDHGKRIMAGQGTEEWRKILNLLYLPGVDKAVLYDSMSPVNTFRLIFNQYFNTDYKLLPDD